MSMANVNFSSFTTVTPRGNDYFIGYRNSSETKTLVSSLTALNLPYVSSTDTLRANSGRYENTFNSVYTVISPNTGNWNSTYSTVRSFSGFWGQQPDLSLIQATSSSWNEAYFQSVPAVSILRDKMSQIQVTSGAWDATTALVYTGYPIWNNTVSNVAVLTSQVTNLSRASANWDSTYTYVIQSSSNITYWTNYVTVSSSNWDYAYSSVESNKALWDGSASIVKANSATWNDSLLKSGGQVVGAVTTTQTNTAAFTLNEFVSRRYVDAMAIASTISGNFVPSLYYNKIDIDSKLLPLQADLSNIKPLTGSWNSVYTTVNANSASFLTTASARSIFVALTGGTISGNLTVQGSLSVLGDLSYVDTIVSITSALSVTNFGTGPAISVRQNGNQPVAIFRDDNRVALYIEGNTTAPGFVGIGTSLPNENLTVVGDISASQIIFANQISVNGVTQDRWNSTYTSLQTVSAKTMFLETNIIEVSSDLTINNINCDFYTNKILHLSSNNVDITITFLPTISGTFTLSMINLGSRDVFIEPDDNTYIKSASYTIYGGQFSTATIYKYNNQLFLLGTTLPA